MVFPVSSEVEGGSKDAAEEEEVTILAEPLSSVAATPSAVPVVTPKVLHVDWSVQEVESDNAAEVVRDVNVIESSGLPEPQGTLALSLQRSASSSSSSSSSGDSDMGSGGDGPTGRDGSDEEDGSSCSCDGSTSEHLCGYFVSKEDHVANELNAFGARLVGGREHGTVHFASSKKEHSLLEILSASLSWRRSC